MREENIINNNDNEEENNNEKDNNNEEDNNLEDNNEEKEEENKEKSNFETLKVDYNKLISLPDNIEIFEGKFSLLTHFQEKCFDPNTYVKENKIKIKNEKDEIEYKYIPLENYIRWKYNNNKKIISNAKMV